MKSIVAVVSALVSFSALAWGFGPGGGGGGGGNQPGGGGNQPGGGGGSSFTFDTFITDSTTSGGCIIYGDLVTGYVVGESQIVIPASVKQIADGAFAGNMSVTSIDATAATSLSAVPESFASGCDSLTSVTLPSAMTTIGDSAFTMSSALASFTGDGVTTIGDYAFYGCSSLVLPVAVVANAETGESALSGVSLRSTDNEVYPSEAADLVAWVKAAGAVYSSLPTQPTTCNTADLKLWLTNDVRNLEKYLYSSGFATDQYYSPISVDGMTFTFDTPDAGTSSVAHAALQTSDDFVNWQTVPDAEITDGVYSPAASTQSFVRIIYSLLW